VKTQDSARTVAVNRVTRDGMLHSVLRLLVCLAVSATSGYAVTLAINLDHYAGGVDVNDLGSGGYYWTTVTLGSDVQKPTPGAWHSLKDATGAATGFEIRSNNYIRLSSAGNPVSTAFTLDGVRLPANVASYGYGGIDSDNPLNQWLLRVPVTSGLGDWSFQLFAGDNRNGGLSPIAANVGGTFAQTYPPTTSTFTGGVTTTFTGPATDPLPHQGMNWFRSGRLDNIDATIQNFGGIDYYVATLQFADTGRLVAGTVDYGSLHAFVLTALPVPEPGALTLLGLAAPGLLARRRPARA